MKFEASNYTGIQNPFVTKLTKSEFFVLYTKPGFITYTSIGTEEKNLII